MFFVQIAARRGARVVAVASAGNADYARRLGVNDVVDYTTGDVAETVRKLQQEGIDVTLIPAEKLTSEELSRDGTLVLGIRA